MIRRTLDSWSLWRRSYRLRSVSVVKSRFLQHSLARRQVSELPHPRQGHPLRRITVLAVVHRHLMTETTRPQASIEPDSVVNRAAEIDSPTTSLQSIGIQSKRRVLLVRKNLARNNGSYMTRYTLSTSPFVPDVVRLVG